LKLKAHYWAEVEVIKKEGMQNGEKERKESR